MWHRQLKWPGESNLKNARAHTLGRRLRRWIFYFFSLKAPRWFEHSLLNPAGPGESARRIQRCCGGASSAGGMKRGSIPLWSCSIPPSLWKCEEEREAEWGSFKPGVDGEGEGEKIEQDQFMIQLCVKEDFPVSRCSLARLKGPPDQTQPFFIYISALTSCLNLWLAGDLLETCFLTLEGSISLLNTLKLGMYVFAFNVSQTWNFQPFFKHLIQSSVAWLYLSHGWVRREREGQIFGSDTRVSCEGGGIIPGSGC